VTHPIRFVAVVPMALVAAFGFVACDSRDDSFNGPPSPLVASDSGAEAAVPPESCAGLRCSRDLHEIVDGCTDAVVTECGPNLGCSNGRCVAACESAATAQGSIGCSFWTAAPDVLRNSETGCFAAFIANTWDQPAAVTAEFGSDAIDISKSIYRAIPKGGGVIDYEPITTAIAPGDVGIVFLSQGKQTPDTIYHVSCPPGVKVAFDGIVTKEHQTSVYKAFHLSTNVPVSAYSIFPYGGAKSYIPSATLLTPSTSWDTSYLLVDAWRYQHRAGLGYPFVQIVAQENTEVRLRPKVPVLDGLGVTGGPSGSIVKWNLNRGEVLELTQVESLAGSALETSHPVALFGGNQCANLPDEVVACDSLHQQIPPVHQWSSTYSAVPFSSRRKTIQGAPKAAELVYWQVVAANEGTVLTYEPSTPVGAPTKLEGGQRAFFETSEIFSVKSQDKEHPIYLAVYMTGAERYSSLGDPDFVNIIPNDQFLDRYVFFVDHTYADSSLTLVRRRDVNGFHDVTLDCAGPVKGWQPLGDDGSTEYTWVDITRGGLDVTTSAGTCTHGRHEASSPGPFGLYVWGMDTYASYGFPAGKGSRPTSPFTVVVR
jgi:hypothetical protein